MKVGILALQGAFREHITMLNALEVESVVVRSLEDLTDIEGLIIPGGESTTMMKLLVELNLFDGLREIISAGLPTWGTCAGMILLSDSHLDVMNITVKRNAYGNQSGSFTCHHEMDTINSYPMVFIRAPYIIKKNNTVTALSVYDEKIVAAKENNILVTSFHPELTDDTSIHRYFIDMIRNSKL